ncbi:LapA family protein [Marispirochaeta aestuarii]|uniref:LapA family protein n=2 Tax=Marispirochaeta aestuarii TaxID=1963862 RepID=UPI0029C872C7|nr:LapA family protein [Marispirochaeta aestuarii]
MVETLFGRRIIMQKVKLGLIVGLSLALILVVIQNTTSVRARFLWFSGDAPVILLLVLTGVGGFILGLLVALLNFQNKRPDRSE